jgi:hypothetical protein
MSTPVLVNAIPGDSNVTIYFTVIYPATNPIVNFQYSLDGIQYIPFDPPSSSYVNYTITNLTNGTLVTITLQSIFQDNTVSLDSNSLSVIPGLPPTDLLPMVNSNSSATVFFLPHDNTVNPINSYYDSIDGINYINSNITWNTSINFAPYQSVIINKLYQQQYPNIYLASYNQYGRIGIASSPVAIDFSYFTNTNNPGSYFVNVTSDTSLGILSHFNNIVSYLNIQSISNNSIPTDAFAGFSQLLGVTIPSSIASIGSRAFSQCNNLLNITFVGGTSIGNDVIPYDAFDLSGNQFANVGLKVNGFPVPYVYPVAGSYLGLNVVLSSGITDYTTLAPFSSLIQGITFDSTVTDIVSGTFQSYCHDVVSEITIDSSGVTIGDNAFQNFTNLNTLTFTSTNASVAYGNNVFQNCTSLTNVNGVSVDLSSGLLNVTISQDSDYQVLKYIGPCVISVVIGSSVSDIPAQAFANCTQLQTVESNPPNGLYNIKTIGYRAFYNCSQIQTLSLTGVITAADEIFVNCSNLTTLYLNANISTMGDNCFSGCSQLSVIHTTVDIFVDVSENAIDGNKAGLRITFYQKPPIGDYYDFNGAVVSFRSNVYTVDFSGNDPLNPVNPPTTNPFSYIYTDTFANYTGLQNITIPYGCTEVGTNSFTGCTRLKHVDCGESWCFVISDGAFSNCTQLQSFVVPPNLSYRDSRNNLFQGCSQLNQLYNTNGDYVSVAIVEKAIQGLYTGIEATFNQAKANEYYYTIIWPLRKYVTSVVYDNSVTVIGAFGNYYCGDAQHVTLPNGVQELGYRCFDNFTSLTEITLPSSITSFDTLNGYASTFRQCWSLQTVHYDTSVNIPRGCFYECVDLSNVYITSNITSIGDEAFVNCRSLKTITLPNTITTLYDSCFSGSALESIEFSPDSSLHLIGGNVFTGSTLKSIVLPPSATFYDNAFRGCYYLESFTMYTSTMAAIPSLSDLVPQYPSGGTYTVNPGDPNYTQIYNYVLSGSPVIFTIIGNI